MDEYQRRFGDLTAEQALYRVLRCLQLESGTALLHRASPSIELGLGHMAKGIVVPNVQINVMQIRELLGDQSRGSDMSSADAIRDAIAAIAEKTGKDYSALAGMARRKIDLEAISQLPTEYRGVVQDLLLIQEANEGAPLLEIDAAIIKHFS